MNEKIRIELKKLKDLRNNRHMDEPEFDDKVMELFHALPAENYICCEELGNALGDHNGLHSQTIGSIADDKIDSIIMYKGGDYKIRNRIIVQYCPFCGKPRRRASEYKKEA